MTTDGTNHRDPDVDTLRRESLKLIIEVERMTQRLEDHVELMRQLLARTGNDGG